MQLHVLVADDDAVLRSLLCDILKKQGYHPIPAKDGKEALDLYFSGTDFSLCILDVMMPEFDGWQVLEEIRAAGETPVLMLTALEDEQYEVKGLMGGADDYIAKPFSYPVFVARIESLLRKAKKEQASVQEYGGLKIDRLAHKVFLDEDEIVLNNKEYRLLTYLTSNQNLVLEREQILTNIWGFDFEGESRIVDAHIKMLRGKLGKYAAYIATVRGVGYKFEVVNL